MQVRAPNARSVHPEAAAAASTRAAFICEPVTPEGAARVRLRVKELRSCGCGMQPGGALAKAGSAACVTHGFVVGPALSGADAAILQTGVAASEVEKALAPKLPGLVQTFKEIHADPELSEKEPKTAKRVADRLEQLGYSVARDFGQYADPTKPIHSVVATFKNGPGPTLLIRADMDALPIKEESGVPYASKNDGIMHACGHDAHTTVLLGTAELLMEMKDRWSGTLILVGQPAEEVGTGARAMVLAGKLYEKFGKPDFALGMHVHAEHRAGSVRISPGYVMAHVDSLDVTMRGRGGHGAWPHLNVDPVLMTANFLVQLQQVVSRETRPGDPAVVTAGKIAGGTARNIIPNEVKTDFTLRSFSDTTRARLRESVARVANGVAAAANAPADKPPIITEITDFCIPGVFNNPELTERLKKVWAQLKDVGEMAPIMGGDDFTYFSLPDHSVPAVYFFVGSTDPKIIDAGGPIAPMHSNKFVAVPEPTISAGVTAMVTAATSLLARSS